MLRRRIFQFITFSIVAFTIFGAVVQKKSLGKLKSKSSPEKSMAADLEEKAFSMQSKLILSLIDLIETQKSISKKDKASTKESLVNSSKTFLLPAKKDSKFLNIKKIIFSQHLGLATNKLCLKNEDKLTKDICNKKTFEFTEDQSKKLSWFSKLYEKKEAIDKKILSKFGFGFAILIFVILASIISFLFYLFYFFVKKPKYEFKHSSINSDYCLEIFCLYLLGMNLMPFLLVKIDYNPLKLNIIGIFSLTTLILWPLIFRQSFSNIRQSLGLSFKKFPKDIFIGAFTYIASILPLIALLSIYSLILLKLGVNAEQGAHPVVPILTKSKDSSIVYIIFILAVVVAPIVEEVMFRGAFYSWLRDRLNAPLSILISALIFAAIHPQGAIGILPLGFIGAVLAILREWRGSITSCIIAHACFNAGTLIMVVTAFR